MKTMNSKLQKAEKKSLIIAISFFAAVLTINAQGAAIENSTMNTEAMALLANVASTKTTATATTSRTSNFAAYIAEEKEAGLELEDWMLNENSFVYHFNLEEATEEALEVETWMIDVSYFGIVNYLETETEEVLEVETWMLEDSLFNKKEKAKAKEKSESANENETLAEVKTETKKKAVGITNQKTQFGRRAMILVEDEDPKLKMEQWMLDYRHWNKK